MSAKDITRYLRSFFSGHFNYMKKNVIEMPGINAVQHFSDMINLSEFFAFQIMSGYYPVLAPPAWIVERIKMRGIA